MSRIIPWSGGFACLVVGWLLGRSTSLVPSSNTGSGSSAIPHHSGSFTSVPRDMNRPQAKTWLASLGAAEIQERILQVSKEPETRYREKQLLALFSRLFELDGPAAADLWLRIEADCQPDLKGEIARWASASPEEAIEWFSRSGDQVRRYRAGFLVVDLAGAVPGLELEHHAGSHVFNASRPGSATR